MKAVFIPYNQAYREDIMEIFDKLSIRGFTNWETVQGRGTRKGEPHYGTHAWPTLNSSIITVIPDEKVKPLLQRLKELDMKTEAQGLHAYVLPVEDMI